MQIRFGETELFDTHTHTHTQRPTDEDKKNSRFMKPLREVTRN
jgi:hypothetical protein